MKMKVWDHLTGYTTVILMQVKAVYLKRFTDTASDTLNGRKQRLEHSWIRVEDRSGMLTWDHERMPRRGWMEVEKRNDRFVLVDTRCWNRSIDNATKQARVTHRLKT